MRTWSRRSFFGMPNLPQIYTRSRHGAAGFFVEARRVVLVSWWCLTRILRPTPFGRQGVNGLGALSAITPPVSTRTHDTDRNRESVVTLRKKRAAQFTDRSIPFVRDNARHPRPASVLAAAARLTMT